MIKCESIYRSHILEQKHAKLAERWPHQRRALQLGVKFAVFIRECSQIVQQLKVNNLHITAARTKLHRPCYIYHMHYASKLWWIFTFFKSSWPFIDEHAITKTCFHIFHINYSDFQNWQDDMIALVKSDNFTDRAQHILPYQEDNTIQVKNAVAEVKNNAAEILQVRHSWLVK